MEHHEENNTMQQQQHQQQQQHLLDTNFTENLLMDNLQMSCGGGVGVVGDMNNLMDSDAANNLLGGKFEELSSADNNHHHHHDNHFADDDEERKYIEEVHQSEKQQSMNYGFGAGDAVGQLGDLLMGNGGGVDGIGIEPTNHHHYVGEATAMNTAVEEEELDILLKQQDVADNNILQVEMKIEEQQHQPQHEQNEQKSVNLFEEEEEEEEPSSLATNGTSSLSEQAPLWMGQQQSANEPAVNAANPFDYDQDDKENADPLIAASPAVAAIVPSVFTETESTNTDALDFDADHHSQLNPDAKEFVPSFGSNPTSPTVILATEPNFEAAVEVKTAVPPHLLDDDFVASSPRKGKLPDMDAIALPAELEFEHEAALRPHELEQDDDLMGSNGQTTPILNADCADFVQQPTHSPANSFIDHGPETCVDVDVDMENKHALLMQEPETVEAPIEDVLNTVQTLPESLNTSFIEHDAPQEQDLLNKESLQVEEKEHLSQLSSPSTEELQMNLKNAADSADFLQQQQQHLGFQQDSDMPIDMNSADSMQKSFYMENTSSEAIQLENVEAANNVSLLDNDNNDIEDASFEHIRGEAAPEMEIPISMSATYAADQQQSYPFALDANTFNLEENKTSTMVAQDIMLEHTMDQLKSLNLMEAEPQAQIETQPEEHKELPPQIAVIALESNLGPATSSPILENVSFGSPAPDANSTPFAMETTVEPIVAAAVAATAAVGAGAAVVAKKKIAESTKKPTAPKSSATSSLASKPKVEPAKRSQDAKKTSSTTTTAAKSGTTTASSTRPRTAPAAASSRPAPKPASTLSARKPLTTAASKPTVKTTSSTTAAANRPATAGSAPPKTNSVAAARAAAAKARPATAGAGTASKPSTLGRTGATTSTVRKTTSTTTTAAPKSPTKPALSNGLSSRAATSSTTTTTRVSKSSASTGTTTTTTTTKTFTARPAPKFTHTPTVTSTRRSLAPPTSSAKPSNPTPLRKTASPTKASPLKSTITNAAARASSLKTTTTTTAAALKTKTKEATKPSSASKSSPITRKSLGKTNGAAAPQELEKALVEEVNGTEISAQNGTHDLMQNGGCTVEQPELQQQQVPAAEFA